MTSEFFVRLSGIWTFWKICTLYTHTHINSLITPAHIFVRVPTRIRLKVQRVCNIYYWILTTYTHPTTSNQRAEAKNTHSSQKIHHSAKRTNTLSPITTSSSNIKPRIPLLFPCYVHPWWTYKKPASLKGLGSDLSIQKPC